MKTQANLQAYQAARKARRQACKARRAANHAYADALFGPAGCTAGYTRLAPKAVNALFDAATNATDEARLLRDTAVEARAAYYAKPPCISVEWPSDGVNPLGAAQHLSMTRRQLAIK